jgi:hypothetical protein
MQSQEELGRTCLLCELLAELFAPFSHAHAHPLVMRCWRGRICQIADKILLSATL